MIKQKEAIENKRKAKENGEKFYNGKSCQFCGGVLRYVTFGERHE